MTPRERFRRTQTNEKIDRFFSYDHGPWPSTVKRWEKEGYPANVNFEEYFGYDRFYRLPFNTGYTNSPFFPPFPHRELERSPDHVVVSDCDGIVKKILKEDADLSMPQFLRFPVETRNDWREVEKRLLPGNASLLCPDYDSVAALCAGDREFPVLMPICGAWGHPRNLLGDANLCMTLYDDPGLIKDILANWLSLYKAVVKEVVKGIEVDCLLIWEDMCYRNGPLISPASFEEFLLPGYRELVDFAKRSGIPSVWVDTDGDCSKLIPLFLEAGVNGIMPFEVQAGMEVARVRRQYGASFVIMGGIDKRPLAGDKSDIKREVDRVVPFFLESGMYIPTLDHTVPVNVPLENYKYYVECVRSYRI